MAKSTFGGKCLRFPSSRRGCLGSFGAPITHCHFSWELIAPQSLTHSGGLQWLCFLLMMVTAPSSSSSGSGLAVLPGLHPHGLWRSGSVGLSGRDREDLLQITVPCQKQSVYSVSARRIPPRSALNRLYPIPAGTETPFCSLGGIVTTGDIYMTSSKVRVQSPPELLSQFPIPRSACGCCKHVLCFSPGGPCQPEFSYGSCH